MKPPPSPPRRAARTLARREAIVAAALETFSAHGFAAARMEDVAKLAGVAKGTIYLHFKSKEALFEGIVEQVIVPIVERIRATEPGPGEPVRAFAERLMQPFTENLGSSHVGKVLRLLVAEGGRFPQLAETYYRLVVSRGLAAIRELARHAAATGELRSGELARFPQLVVAPLLTGLIWSGLFEGFEPLDGPGLLAAQLDLLFQPPPPSGRAAARGSDPSVDSSRGAPSQPRSAPWP